jgi:hypothetical protein
MISEFSSEIKALAENYQRKSGRRYRVKKHSFCHRQKRFFLWKNRLRLKQKHGRIWNGWVIINEI